MKKSSSPFRWHLFGTLIAALLMAGLPPGRFCPPLSAHPLGGVFQKTYVYAMGPFFMVEYETHIGRDVLLTLNPDMDRDSVLSETEKHRLLERVAAALVPNLDARMNDVRLAFTEMDRKLAIENPGDFTQGINVSLVFRLSLPVTEKPDFTFRITDRNFLAGELDRLNYFHGIMGNSSGSRLLENGRGLEICFGRTGPEEGNGRFAEAGPGPQNEPSETDIMSDYFTRGRKGPMVFLLAALGAFILGAGHALSPGHGKAMVAAYLVGSKGRVRHAVILGLIVTVTHVAVVVVLGIATLILSDHFMPQDLFPWLGGISGAMICGIGYWMLAGRALHGMAHTHGHHHHHTDHHMLNGEAIRIKGLFAMGIAGGIVPCPSALVVLLLSLSFQRVAEGLGLIVFFSLGLAAVLILIGVLTVTASGRADRFSRSRTWIQYLPVFSAGCIMVIGIAVIFTSFLSAGIIQLNW